MRSATSLTDDALYPSFAGRQKVEQSATWDLDPLDEVNVADRGHLVELKMRGRQNQQISMLRWSRRRRPLG
jgi:hypothetical protein